MKNSVTKLPFNRFIDLQNAATPEKLLLLPAGDQFGNHLGPVHASALSELAEVLSGEYLLRHFGVSDGLVLVVRRLEAKFRRPANGPAASTASAAPEALPLLNADFAAKRGARVSISVELHDDSGAHARSATVERFIQRLPSGIIPS